MVWGRDKNAIRMMVAGFLAGGGELPEAIRGMSPDQVADNAEVLLRGLLTNIREADLVSVTTQALANEYAHLNSNIWVLPNQMQPDFWADLDPIPHPGEIWVGWAGGWTHLDDLRLIVTPMNQVLRQNPNVRFVLIGFTQAAELIFQDLPQEQIIELPWHPDFHGYHNSVASLDVVLAPSRPIQFNDAKSDIRVMEAWLCNRPCVGSQTTYGDTIRESGGGFVAKNNKGWLQGINRLVRNEDLRRQMGQAGYNYVMQHRTYDGNAHRWAEALASLD